MIEASILGKNFRQGKGNEDPGSREYEHWSDTFLRTVLTQEVDGHDDGRYPPAGVAGHEQGAIYRRAALPVHLAVRVALGVDVGREDLAVQHEVRLEEDVRYEVPICKVKERCTVIS